MHVCSATLSKPHHDQLNNVSVPSYKPIRNIVRIISNSSYLCHTKPLFDKFNMLNINKLHNKELSVFMYKYHNGLLPISFNNLFTNMKNIHIIMIPGTKIIIGLMYTNSNSSL